MHAITSSDGGKSARNRSRTNEENPIPVMYVRLWVAGPIWLKLAVWDLLLCLGYSLLSLRLIHAMHALTTPFLVCVWPMFHNYSAVNSAVRH